MSNDEQQHGGRHDGLGQRVLRQTAQDRQHQGPRRPDAGKVTLTSKLAPDRQPAVQRQTAAPRAPSVVGAPVRSLWDATSADMDAAHRGTRAAVEGDAVQSGGSVQAQGANGARVLDIVGRSHDVSTAHAPVTRGARAASTPRSGGTPRAVQTAASRAASSSPAVASSELEGPAPALSCADALLAALPPEQTVEDAQRVFDTAEREVASVIAEQMTYSDIKTFHAIQRAHAQHPIARRFQRFGGARRSRLLALLADSKVRARAYEREVALGERAAVEQHEPDPVGGVSPAPQAQLLDDGPMHDPPGLERGLQAAPTRVPRSPAPAVQAKPASEMPLEKNAEKDAVALLRAFQGIGTDDQVVYRVLNQPSEMLQAIVRAYNAHHNQLSGQGLVEDLRDEFDHVGSQDDWHFVLGQLTRAGIAVPDAALRYQRQDPSAEHQGGMRIAASPDVRVAVPGTRVTYTLVHGHKGLHSASAPYRYQWYVLNDAVTSRMLGKPARLEGGDGPQAEATARFPGNHKVICKVTPRSGRGAGVPTFYEFPQTVVPEGTLAQDALQQAPAAVEPARQLELLETFLHVLREAEKQPGSAALDPETGRSYEKQIAALRNRLASTEGAERIPIRAVHVDREKARVSPLRAFVARAPAQAGEQETWRLVDITNPESRRLSGEYEGTGNDAREAILAALAAWDTRNRYAPGRIQLEVGAEAAGVPIAHTFQTDGMSFWDSITEFFAEVGFWTGMGALAAGVVTAVVPVPGMRVVSGLIWTSILASTAATTINLAQRHAEGMSTAREDAMDVLTIAGNILAGAWLSKARVLLNGQGGTKIGTGLLIGQLGSDGAQGIVLGIEYLDQYERVMAIEDPKQRTDALMELLRSAALAGGMLFLSVQGAKKDLGHLGAAGAHGGPGHPGGTPGGSGPDGLGNLAAGSDAGATARTGHATGSEPAATSRETSPGPTRARGADDAQLERISTALREAGLDARLLARLGDDTVARLAHPSVLSEIEQVARLQRSGRITGLDDWIEFGAAKDAADLGRVAGELREARRLVAENPGAMVNIGGDARAPRDSTNEDRRLASFDLAVEKPIGTVQRSIEVTTLAQPVDNAAKLTPGVRHAADKVVSRLAEGQPIPGLHDATIRITLAHHTSQGRKGTVSIDAVGNRVLHTPNGNQIPQGNIFDQLVAALSTIANHQHLDRVTLVDAISGRMLAQYERTGTVWSRIH